MKVIRKITAMDEDNGIPRIPFAKQLNDFKVSVGIYCSLHLHWLDYDTFIPDFALGGRTWNDHATSNSRICPVLMEDTFYIHSLICVGISPTRGCVKPIEMYLLSQVVS